MSLFNLCYYTPINLANLSEQLYKQGDFEGSEFINEEIEEHKKDLKFWMSECKLEERRSDELTVGMNHIWQMLTDLKKDINNSQRISKKEILSTLTEIIQEFDEYL